MARTPRMTRLPGTRPEVYPAGPRRVSKKACLDQTGPACVQWLLTLSGFVKDPPRHGPYSARHQAPHTDVALYVPRRCRVPGVSDSLISHEAARCCCTMLSHEPPGQPVLELGDGRARHDGPGPVMSRGRPLIRTGGVAPSEARHSAWSRITANQSASQRNHTRYPGISSAPGTYRPPT